MRSEARTTLSLFLLLGGIPGAVAAAEEVVRVEGLRGEVVIERGEYDIPRLVADNELDAIFALGMVHAEDRFFQMDYLRRVFSGTLAELLGEEALGSDIELRALGLRRAAEETLGALSPESLAWLAAYTDGVNAYLDDPGLILPPEYPVLELTRAGIEEWSDLDSLVIAKGLAFSLSFDLLDLELTEVLLSFVETGKLLGFDGSALFFEDLYRTAPFDPTISIPGEAGAGGGAAGARLGSDGLPDYLGDRTLRMIRSYKESISSVPLLRRAFATRDELQGSNWWLASSSVTEAGFPLLANDPHLDLSTPSVFYEVEIEVEEAGETTLRLVGVSFPGSPGIVLGCNMVACWGGTVHPMDVTDVYQEEVSISLFPPGLNTIFDGREEPVTVLSQSYPVNQVGDGTDDNFADADVGPLEGGLTFLVPRRNNGPVISVDLTDLSNITALSVQYSGWGATREVEAIRSFATASSPEEFAKALQLFDFGSQNWAYADVNGNIAYFTSAELPLREDLQMLGVPDGGVAPYFIRDGTHQLRHEWMPLVERQPGQALDWEILPFTEMPKEINPERGYILNANNDPTGTSLDNDPLNQTRPGGGALYFNPGYATGFRIGRIQRLFDELLAGGGTISTAEFRDVQANNQLLDAEVLVPYVSTAFSRANEPGAPPELAALGEDPQIIEAVGRLESWDFSTPTGIAEGYDPGDDTGNLPQPDQAEIDASVAATIYSAWRGQVVQDVVDATLEPLGLLELAPSSALAMSALRNMLDSFDVQQGVGLSGVDFFVVDGVSDAADERDVVLLTSLRAALDLLASDEFAPAFGNSTDQEDYRWGYLHRIVYSHPIGGEFDVPPAGGFSDLSPELRGVARAGGFGAVDASSHSARADGLDDFMFGSGPSRRFIGEMNPDRLDFRQVIPGGESGIKDDPHQTDLLELWLTNRYHQMPRPGVPVEVKRLVPAEPQ